MPTERNPIAELLLEKAMMKKLLVALVLFAVFTATALAQQDLPPDPEFALAMGAKVICSAVYVVGRDPEFALKHRYERLSKTEGMGKGSPVGFGG